MDEIDRKIVHVRIRPTYTNINHLIMLAKNAGVKDVPKLESTTKESITIFCNRMANVMHNNVFTKSHLTHSYTKNVYKFEESNLLPGNVYIEKNNDHSLDDIEEETATVYTETSEVSEVEEGYELYEEDEEVEFSD